MKKFYEIAGLNLEVEVPADYGIGDDGVLRPFERESATAPHRFVYERTGSLTPPSGECVYVDGGFRVYEEDGSQVRYVGSVREDWAVAYLRAEHRGKDHYVQLKQDLYPGTIGVKTVLTAMAVEHLVAREGGFLFHSSYIEWQDGAILFTAPSGTGKSTQAELWRCLRGAKIINGDRSAVMLSDGWPIVHGIPFAGSSQICEDRSLPLKAIVYLEQAPVTTIRQLRGGEAFARVWEGVSVNVWDKEDVSRASEGVLQAIRQVPVYQLACTPDESAVHALEEMLKGQDLL